MNKKNLNSADKNERILMSHILLRFQSAAWWSLPNGTPAGHARPYDSAAPWKVIFHGGGDHFDDHSLQGQLSIHDRVSSSPGRLCHFAAW